MQLITLKSGFESVFSEDMLQKLSSPNDFIYIDGNSLEISTNLDSSEMYGSPFGNVETDFFEVISKFENAMYSLKSYFNEDFEIVYFTYNGEYVATMWRYEAGKLMKSSGWIGDFALIEEGEDEDEVRDAFVDENYLELKEGYPSDELLDGLRDSLLEK